MGLEGIVSKRADSKYRSGRCRAWLKTKAMTEGTFLVLGTVREPGSPALALLGREEDGRLLYAGSAFVTLKETDREKFWQRADALAVGRPALQLKNRKASWCRPELSVRVRYL